MGQQIDLCGGESRSRLHQRQRVRLIDQPRTAQALSRACRHVTECLFGPAYERRQRARRNLLFANTEERTDVAIMRNLDNDTLPELGVLDSLAGKQGRTHQEIREWLSPIQAGPSAPSFRSRLSWSLRR